MTTARRARSEGRAEQIGEVLLAHNGRPLAPAAQAKIDELVTVPRRISTLTFRVLRTLLLGRRTPGDSQGTLILRTSLAKRLLPDVLYDHSSPELGVGRLGWLADGAGADRVARSNARQPPLTAFGCLRPPAA